MANAKVGKDGSVKLGSTKVLGMGTWNMPGITTEEFDASEFGDNWKTYLYGMKDGGTITFNGWFNPGDVTGQQILFAANAKNSALNNLKLYWDNTSYFEPNQTTDYLGPGALSTGMGTPGLCTVNVTALAIGADKSGLETGSFTLRINGCMAMV